MTRLQGSLAFSFSSHVLAVGLYIALKLAQPAADKLVLHEVEFLDLKPSPVPEAPAAQLPPRSLTDFLKLALPKQLQEAPRVQEASRPALQELPRLVGKAEPLERAQALKLDARLDRASSANLGELAGRPAPSAAPASTLEAPKAIDLGAVGRRAVVSAAPAIRIEPGGAPPRAGLRDLPAARPSGGSAAGLAAPTAALDLRAGSGPVRRGAAPSIGYSKGGGISLAERPVARPASAPRPAPAPAPAKPAADIAQASSRKAVEISGPLAGRKVLSMTLPRYPDWARERGVEAEIMIRFFVDAEGRVLDRMFTERSSGYKELDDLCMEALKKITFAPLTGGAKEDQWGVITFRFKLS